MYDFSTHKFRCSSLGHLFAETKGKSNLQKYTEAVEKSIKLKSEYSQMKPELKTAIAKLEAIKKNDLFISELEPVKNEKELALTVKKHLLDVYVSNQHGISNNLTNKFLEKGTVCEEDSITLYSRVKKTFFKNNKLRLFNDFIQGEPDLFTGSCISSAEKITDIKTSWDALTFHRNLAEDEVKDLYYYQLQGYMWLTGARSASIAYCLVNTPFALVEQSKKSLWYKLGCPDETSSIFTDCCDELEKSMNYDHISMQEKVIEFEVEYSEAVIEEMKERIFEARKYLMQIQEKQLGKQLTLKAS